MGTWKKLISENSNGEITIANTTASIEPAGSVTFDLVDATKDLQITQSGGSQWDPISTASIATKLYTDTKLPLAGGTLTGAIVAPAIGISGDGTQLLSLSNDASDTNDVRIQFIQSNVAPDLYDIDLLFRYGLDNKFMVGYDSSDDKFKINASTDTSSADLDDYDHFTMDTDGNITLSEALNADVIGNLAGNVSNGDLTLTATGNPGSMAHVITGTSVFKVQKYGEPTNTTLLEITDEGNTTITGTLNGYLIGGIANNCILRVDEETTAANNEFAKFTATGIAGVSTESVLSQLGIGGDGGVTLNAADGEDASVTVNSAAFTPTSDNHIVPKHHLDTQLATKQASLTFGIADTNSLVVDGADIADDEYARFTASGLESRTAGEVKTDLGLDEYAAGAITRTGTFTIDATSSIELNTDSGAFYIKDDTYTKLSLDSSGQLTLHSAIAANPSISLEATNSLAYSPRIYIKNFSGSPAVDDEIGLIVFQGKDAGDNTTTYSNLQTTIVSPVETIETAKVELTLASKGATLRNGLTLTGSASSGEVDTDIGYGVTSLTTIAGNLDIDGDTITSAGALEIDAGGAVSIATQHVKIDGGYKLYFDGGTDTYIHSHENDDLRVTVGDQIMQKYTVDGSFITIDNNQSCVGFLQNPVVYDDTDTYVYFSRLGNKQYLVFDGDDITDLNLYFPDVSGNFVLLIKQDASGGARTIDYYKAFDIDGAPASQATVLFPGGIAPTLTTDVNHVDILSFYWDATNKVAYGVASLDFQF